MTRQKYIIQLYNKRHHYWFDYLTFYNQNNARRAYDSYKRCSNANIHIRLLEVVSYDFE